MTFVSANRSDRDSSIEKRGPVRSSKTLLTISVLAAMALIVSFIFTPEQLPGFSVCMSQQLFDTPCYACGLSHGFCAISHGMFHAAWQYHPASFILYPLFVLVALLPLLNKRFPAQISRFTSGKTFVFCLLLLFALVCIFGFYRSLT